MEDIYEKYDGCLTVIMWTIVFCIIGIVIGAS